MAGSLKVMAFGHLQQICTFYMSLHKIHLQLHGSPNTLKKQKRDKCFLSFNGPNVFVEYGEQNVKDRILHCPCRDRTTTKFHFFISQNGRLAIITG